MLRTMSAVDQERTVLSVAGRAASLKLNRLLMPFVLFGVAATSLVGCGDASDTPGVRGLPAQVLEWKSCLPSEGITEDDIQKFGARLTCATMKAPLDYANPELGTIDIALSRLTAGNPEKRQGVIFFNPGGPGGGGLKMAPKYGTFFNIASPDNPVGAKLLEVGQEYDLIGFDPRGVGESTPLICKSDQYYLPASSPAVDRSATNLAHVDENSRLNAQACLQNTLTKYITTDATVHDMDLARTLLGEKKINYWGTSYGTWLGLWYASVFPEHVNRMVIDGNMDVTQPFRPTAFLGSIEGKENIYEHIIVPYVAENPEKFGLGTSVAEILAAYDAYDAYLKEAFVKQMAITKQAKADEAAADVVAAVTLHKFLQREPTPHQEKLIRLVSHHGYSNDSVANALIGKRAVLLVKQYFKIKTVASVSVGLDNQKSAHLAITCNDTSSDSSATYWKEKGDALAKQYHLYGGSFTKDNCTSVWGEPKKPRPPLSNATRVPHILMVQAQYDGPTPLKGAKATLNSLPNAKMLYITNDYSHGTFPYGTECVDGKIADYLLTGAMPEEKIHTCIGRSVLHGQPALTGENRLQVHEFSARNVAEKTADSISEPDY